MPFISSLLQQLGFLELPFLLCSLLACVVVLERGLLLLRYTITKRLAHQGITLIDSYDQQSREVRSEIASLWLTQQKKKLSSGLRLLNIVVLISPLLGLLGTVLGLVDSFAAISQHSGPVEVSVLAEGLGTAMSTTAVGLMIAVPALVFLQLYSLWIDKLMSFVELVMNKKDLLLNDINLDNISL